MKNIVLIMFIFCMNLHLAYAENKEPAMQDFYAASKITVKEDKPLQQILVPYHIYERIKSPKLNDVRIFNANAGLVPHRIATQKKDELTNTKNLSFSKLVNNLDGLESLIEKYKSSDVDISLSLRAMDTDTSNNNVDVYIGEVGKLKGQAAELNFDWELNQDVSAFFLADVEITDDFKHWESLAEGVNLAQLNTNNTVVKHNKIKLKHFGKKFYRLSIRGENRPDIKEIKLTLKQQQDRPYSVTEELMGKYDDNSNQITYYTQSAKIIKNKLKILIPENNIMANCRVYSRDSDEHNWSLRGSGTVYKITNSGKTLKNDVIDLKSSSDREWKLEVINSGSGFEQKPPTVQFMWQPHVLTFVARGGSPFVLAYGSAAYASKSVSQNSFFNTAEKDEDQLIAYSLISNKVDILGGEEVLKENLIKVTPKTIGLWAILVIGSLMLLFMAFSLLKSSSKNGDEA